MKIKVNGEDKEFEGIDGMNVEELLFQMDVKMPDMVSVELNGSILQRDIFKKEVVKEGDAVEFLYFMGGGNKDERYT